MNRKITKVAFLCALYFFASVIALSHSYAHRHDSDATGKQHGESCAVCQLAQNFSSSLPTVTASFQAPIEIYTIVSSVFVNIIFDAHALSTIYVRGPPVYRF
ncbi:MAG: DUF2946 family protein [Bdellovibrionales bacterium]|nr:DUF2946 family protein [Bdellovibrionales bacterium]